MKKNKIQKLNKLNNKGVTLVEIIVAMAILAVVVVPFVHSFVTAARTNSKARDTLYATTIAEDIMELFEDVNVEKESANIKTIIDEKTAIGVVDAGAVNLDANGVYTIEMGAAALGKYVGESFVGDNYSAKIVLDPCNDTVDEHGNTVSGIYNDYNTANVAQVDAVDARHDGVYAMKKKDDEDIINTISKKTSYSEAELSAGLTKRITIEILDNGKQAGTELQFVKVIVSREYQYGVYSEPIMQEFVYDNTVQTGQKAYEFENLYILYTPLYSNSINRDSIVVNNPANIPFTLYILHEKTADDNDATTGGFANYKVPISVTEGHNDISSIDENFKANVSIRTNLFDISQTGNLDNYLNTNYTLSYRYKASATEVWDYTKKAPKVLNDVLNVKSADGRTIFKEGVTSGRIYSMKVCIYKNGKELVNLSGTKMNKFR